MARNIATVSRIALMFSQRVGFPPEADFPLRREETLEEDDLATDETG
jgi:hypothetical protein